MKQRQWQSGIVGRLTPPPAGNKNVGNELAKEKITRHQYTFSVWELNVILSPERHLTLCHIFSPQLKSKFEAFSHIKNGTSPHPSTLCII